MSKSQALSLDTSCFVALFYFDFIIISAFIIWPYFLLHSHSKMPHQRQRTTPNITIHYHAKSNNIYIKSRKYHTVPENILYQKE